MIDDEIEGLVSTSTNSIPIDSVFELFMIMFMCMIGNLDLGYFSMNGLIISDEVAFCHGAHSYLHFCGMSITCNNNKDTLDSVYSVLV